MGEFTDEGISIMTAVIPQIGRGSGIESLPPDHVKAIFRHHPAGVAVVTLQHGDRLVGFTARIRAEIIQRTRVGSSHLVCLRALSSSGDRPPVDQENGHVAPLIYHDRAYHQLGTASAL